MTETPWVPEAVTASKRRDVVSYIAALDDGEFTSLVSEARATSKDAAVAKVVAFLKGNRG
jgi:hypothetical protein